MSWDYERLQWPGFHTRRLCKTHSALDRLSDSHFARFEGAIAGEGEETSETARLAACTVSLCSFASRRVT